MRRNKSVNMRKKEEKFLKVKKMFSMSVSSLKIAINLETEEMDVIVLVNSIEVKDESNERNIFKSLIVNQGDLDVQFKDEQQDYQLIKLKKTLPNS